MTILLKKNDINVLKYLYHNNNTTIKTIAEAIKKSDTSIRSSIKNINYFCEKNNLLLIEKIDKKYILPVFTANNLHKFLLENPIESAAKQRFNYLMLELILTEKLNLNEKSEFFNVTRKTLSLDLEEIKKFLQKKDLYLESIPWKGIFLKGDFSNKTCLSIEFILKILLEKETNNFTTENYKLNKLFYQYIPNKIESLIYNFVKNIFLRFNIVAGTHIFNAFFASCIYCFLKKEQNIINNLNKNLLFNEIKKIPNEYLIYFNSKEFLEEYPFFKNNNLFLARALTRLSSEFLNLKLKNNDYSKYIIEYIEKSFEFKFTENSKVYLIQLLGIAKFKYEYQINHLSSSFNDISIKDNILINKINSLLFEMNINIYEEDLTLIILLIKENLIKFSLEKNKKKILIIDKLWNCWLGKMIKEQLINNFSNLNITVESIYLLEKNDILKLNPDFIIYTEFEFNDFFENINVDKIQFKHVNIFKYINYFERLGFLKKEIN